MENLRNEIDKIDAKISKLLDERFSLCRQIGEYKKNNGIFVQDTLREQAVIENVTLGKENAQQIAEVYNTVFAASKEVQK